MDTNLTLEWSEYNQDYEKRVQDIRLKDGTEILKCWPNAGKWFSMNNNKQKDILDSEVTHTKLHNKLFYR